MKNLVTREEAALIRHVAADGHPVHAPDTEGFRIWQPPNSAGHDDPIGVVSASGRAGCRECGETIAAAEDAIVFGFSPTGAVWNVGRAYIHAAPCRDYTEEER